MVICHIHTLTTLLEFYPFQPANNPLGFFFYTRLIEARVLELSIFVDIIIIHPI